MFDLWYVIKHHQITFLWKIFNWNGISRYHQTHLIMKNEINSYMYEEGKCVYITVIIFPVNNWTNFYGVTFVNFKFVDLAGAHVGYMMSFGVKNIMNQVSSTFHLDWSNQLAFHAHIFFLGNNKKIWKENGDKIVTSDSV